MHNNNKNFIRGMRRLLDLLEKNPDFPIITGHVFLGTPDSSFTKAVKVLGVEPTTDGNYVVVEKAFENITLRVNIAADRITTKPVPTGAAS